MTISVTPGFSPQARGAVCSVCHRHPLVDTNKPGAERVPVVDFDEWIDEEGNLEICANCVTEAAQKLGMLTTEQAGVLINESAALGEQITELRAELETKQSALDALTADHAHVARKLAEARADA